MSLGTMKQYKLTAWPELPPRFQKTTMRRVVSELSQRFVSTRDLARSCGAGTRDIEELVAQLQKDGMLMTRTAPQSVGQPAPWQQWWPVAAVRGMVRAWR
jgi:tRNA G26 N,N-dimethylase Trm1